MIYAVGATSQSLDILIVDDTGLPVTGLVAATFPTLTYSLAGPNADVSFPALSDLAAITTAYASGGVKERAVGVYRLDVPNGVFTTQGAVTVKGETTNKRVLCPALQVGLPVPAEAAGRPTEGLAVLRRVWEWSVNKRTRDRSTGTVLLRDAADSSTLETQTQSTSSTTDTITKGA